MPIRNADELTAAVLAAAAKTPDGRTRELLTLAIRHLHAFVREARLTEAEFRALCGHVVRAGQLSGATHNEVVLAAGSLGISALVCLLNNAGEDGAAATTANLMGPFWRQGAPLLPDGASIVHGPTPGAPVEVHLQLQDARGHPVAGAEVQVWQASPEGYYENQDPLQPDMNLRGRFTSDAAGQVRWRTVRPAGYPVPVNGPVGALLRAQGRHNLRPAHLHVMVHKAGWKTQFSQLYDADDPQLEDDVQWGATEALVVRFEPVGDDPATGYRVAATLVLQPGDATLPPPPITGKSTSPRPALTVLQRVDSNTRGDR
jgi:hydroxyquinol 1,2-dioxygenase